MDRDQLALSDVIAGFFYPFLLSKRRYRQFLRMPKEMQLEFIHFNTGYRMLVVVLSIPTVGAAFNLFIDYAQAPARTVTLLAVVFAITVLWWRHWQRKYLDEHENDSGEGKADGPVSIIDILVNVSLPLAWSLAKRCRFLGASKEDKVYYVSLSLALFLNSMLLAVMSPGQSGKSAPTARNRRRKSGQAAIGQAQRQQQENPQDKPAGNARRDTNHKRPPDTARKPELAPPNQEYAPKAPYARMPRAGFSRRVHCP